MNGPFGANMIAVRDNETAARVIGVPVLRTKLLAFALSSAIIAVAGVLWAFTYLRTVEPAGFNLDRSFQILFIVIIGGLASIRGAFLGAAFIVVLPLLLSNLAATLFGGAVNSGTLELVQRILLGVLIILFLIVEPEGLSAVIERLRARLLRSWRSGAAAQVFTETCHELSLQNRIGRGRARRSSPRRRSPTSSTSRCRATASGPMPPAAPASSAGSSTT